MIACRALPVALLAALPLTAHAEGGRLVFDCTSEAGHAEQFVVAPAEVDENGRGPIVVTYRGTDYDGVASSFRGPFQFGTDTDHFALLIEGETTDGALSVTLHHATETTSKLTPFTCETDF